jgi:RecQ family ATP-dependent DNA helicase
MLEGRDVLGILPTGAGKSLTFQLPALILEGITLVVSPLIALMDDQVAQLATKGIHSAAAISSRASSAEVDDILAAAESGKLSLLYVAPERLTSARFTHWVQRLPLSRLVVDEAHCVSEWGHNFRPDYRRIRDFRTLLPSIPVAALTATATPVVRRDIVSNLGLKSPEMVVGDFDRPNLSWKVTEAHTSGKLGAIRRALGQLSAGSAIVYTPSRASAEKTAAYLSEHGYRAAPYHAGLPMNLREQTQRQFQEGNIQVVCATIAFGMGVHKDDVRHVIHYAMPRSLEAYYQEAGRAGRDGLEAECTLLYSRGDLRYSHQRIEEAYPDRELLRKIQLAAVKNELRTLVEQEGAAQDAFALGLSALTETGYLEGNAIDGYAPGKGGDQGARAIQWLERHRRAELDRLYKVRDYAETDGCRSKVLVGYFGQALDGCGHCDGCVAPKAKPMPASAPVTVTVAAAWTADHQEVYEQLRSWRWQLAQSWGVPAFHIMSDKVLKEAARVKPLDKESFLGVSGLGEKKWEAFGRDLVRFLETR